MDSMVCRVTSATLIVAVVVIVVVVGVAVALLRWERYRPRHTPVHALPTSEVFVDPETQRRLRVWIDPVTGARDYREDADPRTTALPPLERPGLFLPPSPTADVPALPSPPDDHTQAPTP